MNPAGPRTPFDPLHHLSAVARASSHAAPAPRVSRAVRTHRRLVRFGYVLLIVGPGLALAHLVSDSQRVDSSWWTYTLASYEFAIIITIVAVALVLRAPPNRAGQREE